MSGNADANKKRFDKEAEDRKERIREATKNATGQGENPGVGSEKWAKERGK